MGAHIHTVSLRRETDVVLARQRALRIAEGLGFEAQDQTRIASTVSEVARNAFGYAVGGTVEFVIEGPPSAPALTIRVSDRGPGIAGLDRVLSGAGGSGATTGLIGARRLMDRFEVETAPGEGTVVVLGKELPRGAPAVTSALLDGIAERLAREDLADPVHVYQQQNEELLRTLAALQARQEELTRLNRELEDTNRGVVALYAELDERAEQLRRANHVKAQFLSYMSHEFRTPLDSILALSGVLLERMDGELTEEQEKQISFVRRSARDLLNLVDDLLDTARVESGQVRVRPVEFTIEDLFNTLRALLRPLLTNDAVSLVVESTTGLPPMHTDEAKVAQTLRNFISNALKFTERGEIRVAAAYDGVTDTVQFSVRDSGIGIPADHHERIFQDFAQVDSPLQRKVRGTGLGLPLTRKLAELLGGSVRVESEPGRGSTFFATLPRRTEEPTESEPSTGEVTHA